MAAAALEVANPNITASDEDAEFEEDYDVGTKVSSNADDSAVEQLQNGVAPSTEQSDGDELSDVDAEGEEEEVEQGNSDGEEDEAEDGEEDAEGEDEEEFEDAEGVGAVKIQPGLDEDEDDDEDDEGKASSDNDSESSSEAEAEAEWEAAAAEEDEGDEAEALDPNQCIFCHQDEEHDPAEEFEEALNCAVCDNFAHRQCARNASAFGTDEDDKNWRCPSCVEHDLRPDVDLAEVLPSSTTTRATAPKLTRDLLPAPRGGVRPDSHSVFNQLIVNDDPLDGSRTLRKRKTSSAEGEEALPPSPARKRRTVTLTTSADKNGTGDKAISDKRSSRSLRPKNITQPPASILKRTKTNFIMAFRLDATELKKIVSRPPNSKQKKRSRRDSSHAPIVPVYPTTSYSQPFYSLYDKDTDELKSKPYGGILTEAEADTSRTFPQPDDRKRFEDARQKSEDEWKLKTALEQAEAEKVKKPRKVSGPASQIECINFGGYEIDTWYAAPYPEEYSRNRVLYICEFCLKYMSSDYVAWRHKLKCPAKNPPGDEIYREGSVSIFEVDGRKNPVYCQNLCLLAKLFLGSKTLYYDVEPFLFYVMTEYDELGCHFVGYFSKEKRPSSQNNVSCILTLPIHQRKGYGNLLIDFSYLLTRIEKKSGSPEKPLSDMGLVSYRNYWRLVLCYQLRDQRKPFSIMDISERTGMTADDIVSALEGLRVLVRDPVTGIYAFRLDYKYYDEYIKKWESKNYVRLNPKRLVWTPYIMGRNNASAFDHAPMNTIAPREDEEDEVDKSAEASLVVVQGKTDPVENGLTNGDASNDVAAKLEPTDSDAMDVDIEETRGQGKGKTILPGMGKPNPTPTPSQPINGVSPEDSDEEPSDATWNHDIPPSRFEIFPPLPGMRVTTVSRPRIGTPSRRSTNRRRTTSSRRRSAATPRRSASASAASSSRRRSATGRGPGRFPKGTKKSDFANAESGPGLPSRLSRQRSRLGMEAALDDDELGHEDDDEEKESELELDDVDEEDAEEIDESIYDTPGPTHARRRDTTRSRGMGKGKGIVGPGKGIGAVGLGKGMGKGKGIVPHPDADADEDAEGEDDDLDAEGEPDDGDIDAEGEDDEDAIMDDPDAEGEDE